MATFTPPQDLVVPSTRPDMEPWQGRFLGTATGPARGRNVFLYDDDTAAIEGVFPPAAYNADGSLATLSEDRVTSVFYGARGSYPVNATQQATLEAAGYTVDA